MVAIVARTGGFSMMLSIFEATPSDSVLLRVIL